MWSCTHTNYANSVFLPLMLASISLGKGRIYGLHRFVEVCENRSGSWKSVDRRVGCYAIFLCNFWYLVLVWIGWCRESKKGFMLAICLDAVEVYVGLGVVLHGVVGRGLGVGNWV